MRIDAYHLTRSQRKIEFSSLSDLAKQLYADFYGVYDLTYDSDTKDKAFNLPSLKIFYMAYDYIFPSKKENQHSAIMIYESLCPMEDIWVPITEENQTSYNDIIKAMLNLYEKKDCPDLIQEYENIVTMKGKEKITDKIIREFLKSYIIENHEVNTQSQEYSIDDDDIPF